MFYGYHRISTKEQHLDRGIAGIEEFCKSRGYDLQKIYTDKMTGQTFERPRYIVLKEDVLRRGDTLILFELDRLGRNKADIAVELSYFKDNGIRIMFLDIPTTTIDYGSLNSDMSRLIMDTVNNILIELVSMTAQTEIERKKKRVAEGIAAMKARGEWDKYGRPRVMSKEDFATQYKRVERKEIGTLALMRTLKLNRDTFFRYIREYKYDKSKL
jgi:DNA invertase Pin-like site-specific DNA recombinase